jgi:hypothetical protein
MGNAHLHRFTAGALLALAAAVPASAGIHYQAITRVVDAQGRATETQVEAWAEGEKARVEFRVSANPIAKSGTFLITKDGGKTLFLVNPEDKSFARWNVEAMLGIVGGVMNGGLGPLLKVELSDPKVEKLLEEDGGTVAGLPTRHLRYRTSYTMKLKVLGLGRSSGVVAEDDLWVTDRLRDAGLGVWLRSGPPRTGNADFDKLTAAGYEKRQGFPLKSSTVSTVTQKDKQSVTRRTMEVTEVKTEPVPDSRFDIPPGFAERQLPVGPGGPGGPGRTPSHY